MKFTDTAGQEQLIEMTTDAGAGLNPGDTVRIIYQPETPREMDLEQPLHTSGTFILAHAGHHWCQYSPEPPTADICPSLRVSPLLERRM